MLAHMVIKQENKAGPEMFQRGCFLWVCCNWCQAGESGRTPNSWMLFQANPDLYLRRLTHSQSLQLRELLEEWWDFRELGNMMCHHICFSSLFNWTFPSNEIAMQWRCLIGSVSAFNWLLKRLTSQVVETTKERGGKRVTIGILKCLYQE